VLHSHGPPVRLCERLDGIPLAIELPAVQLRTLTLQQLSSRLEHRFSLLTTGRRGALPHQQTLRATTQWSYDLCPADEQLLWARLSVFAGSFDLAAAEAVCAGGPLAREDILPTLIGLVDKSVVLVGEGMSNRDIAQHLGISKRTVDAHLEHIFGKLGISSRVQLATQLSRAAPSPDWPPPRPGPPGP
jgi:predicted ATPase